MGTKTSIVALTALILINFCNVMDATCCKTRRDKDTQCNQYPLNECTSNDHPDCYWQSDCEEEDHFEFDNIMFGDPIFLGIVPDGNNVERRGPDITTNKLKFPPIDLNPIDFVTSKSLIVVGSDRVMYELPLQLAGFPWLHPKRSKGRYFIPALFRIPKKGDIKQSPLYHEVLGAQAKHNISHQDIIDLLHKQNEWINHQNKSPKQGIRPLLNMNKLQQNSSSQNINTSHPNRRRLAIKTIPYYSNPGTPNQAIKTFGCFIVAADDANAPLLPPAFVPPVAPAGGGAAPLPYPHRATGLLVATYHDGSYGYCTAAVIRRTLNWIWLLTAGDCIYDNSRRRGTGRNRRVAVEIEYWHKLHDPGNDAFAAGFIQPSHHAPNAPIARFEYSMFEEHGAGEDRLRYDSDFAVIKMRNNPLTIPAGSNTQVNRAVPPGEQLLLAYDDRGPGGHPLRAAAPGVPGNYLMMTTYYTPDGYRAAQTVPAANRIPPAAGVPAITYTHRCEVPTLEMREINPIPHPRAQRAVYYSFDGEFGVGGMSGTSTVHVGNPQYVYGVYVGTHYYNDHINRITREKYATIMQFTGSPDPNRGRAGGATSGISGPNAKVSIENNDNQYEKYENAYSNDRMQMEDNYYYHNNVDQAVKPSSMHYYATNIIGNIVTFLLAIDLMLMLIVGITMVLFICFIMGFISLWAHSK